MSKNKKNNQKKINETISENIKEEVLIDFSALRTHLFKLFDFALDRYNKATYDERLQQFNHLRNYLWVSATVITSQYCIFAGIIDKDCGVKFPFFVDTNICFYVLAAISMALSGIAFLIAADTCRGRGGLYPPNYQSFLEYYNDIWDEFENKKGKSKTIVDQLNYLDKAITNVENEIGIKAKKLRMISAGIITSIILSIIAVIPFYKIINML